MGRGEEENKERRRGKKDPVATRRWMEEGRTTRGCKVTRFVVTGSSMDADVALDSASHEWGAAGRTTISGQEIDRQQTKAIPTCGHIQTIRGL